jgi:uncharacterized protein YqeY
MGELADKVNKDMTTAMKEKDKVTLEALRYLKSLFIQNRTSTSPIDENIVIVNHVKKLKDSLTLYPAESENFKNIDAEIAVLKRYLPSELSEAEFKSIVEKAIAENGKNFSVIMKIISPQIKGRFDGKKASEIVKEMSH